MSERDSEVATARPLGRVGMALVILAVFMLADWLQEILYLLPGYRALYDAWPFWVPESVKSVLQIALALGAVMMLQRAGLSPAAKMLGLSRLPGRGLLAAFLSVLPLWVAFALTTPLASSFPLAEVAYLSVLSPLAEEVVYRAFAFGGLRRLAGWGFWPAALLPAAIFGWGHAEGSGDLVTGAAIFAITGLGSVLFAWFYEAWGFDLWVPVALHVLMNLAWNVFAVGNSAFAGFLPTAMQATTLLVMAALTLFRNRIPLLATRAG